MGKILPRNLIPYSIRKKKNIKEIVFIIGKKKFDRKLSLCASAKFIFNLSHSNCISMSHKILVFKKPYTHYKLTSSINMNILREIVKTVASSSSNS